MTDGPSKTDGGDDAAVTFFLRMGIRWKSGASDTLTVPKITEEIVKIFFEAGEVDTSDTPREEWFTAEAIRGIFIFITSNGMRKGDTFFVGEHIVDLGAVAGMTISVTKS